MENNKQLDHFLTNKLSIDTMLVDDPDISLVEEARKKIALRKKPVKEDKQFFYWLKLMVQSKLKFYQVGFSLLLTCVCLVYSLEINENTKGDGDTYSYTSGIIAANSPTASVNSSTLLTSIPTLIIRN